MGSPPLGGEGKKANMNVVNLGFPRCTILPALPPLCRPFSLHCLPQLAAAVSSLLLPASAPPSSPLAGRHADGSLTASGAADRLFLVQLAFTAARNALRAQREQGGGRGEGRRGSGNDDVRMDTGDVALLSEGDAREGLRAVVAAAVRFVEALGGSEAGEEDDALRGEGSGKDTSAAGGKSSASASNCTVSGSGSSSGGGLALTARTAAVAALAAAAECDAALVVPHAIRVLSSHAATQASSEGVRRGGGGGGRGREW